MNAQETAHIEIERLVKSFKDIPAAQRKGLNEMDRVRNLEREIVRVDEEIDKRVSVLYGLNEKEIKIVENK